MKKVIVIGIVVVCIVLMYRYPHAMLNPGELVDGHQELNHKCLSCHKPLSGTPNDKCISCHKLTEIGMDTLNLNNATKEKVIFHQHLANLKCTTCHTDHKGIKPEHSLIGFDHEILNTIEISKCNSCHTQPPDNLHKRLTTECNSCHNTNGWKSAVIFNHNMILAEAKSNCISCHMKIDDSFHQQVKDECESCHTTSKWKPSTFDHSTYFQLDENHNVTCNTCHSNNNFSIYTCYGCHEHSERNLQQEHHEEGIFNITNCTSCHKSSNEHDIIVNRNSNQKLSQQELNDMKDYIKSKDKEVTKENDDDDDD